MTQYADDFLAALDPEVAHLAREQMNDDTELADTQRLGGQRTMSWTTGHIDDDAESVWVSSDELDPAFVYERDNESEAETNTDWVSALIATLPEKQQEVYRLHMVERMSFGQIADELNMSKPAVFDRMERVKAAVAAEAERRGLYQ